MIEKFWLFPSTLMVLMDVGYLSLILLLPRKMGYIRIVYNMSKFLEKKIEDCCWTILLSNSISDIWFSGIVGDICDIFEDKGSFAVSKCLQA